MNLSKEELIFCKHLTECAYSASHKEIRIYTDFLNLNEISIFYELMHSSAITHAMLPQLPDVAFSLWGGITDAERRKICFHGDVIIKKAEITEIDIVNPSAFPISCIHVTPLNYKFSEILTHRDYLGAILNLGLLRSKIGDILIDEKDAYIFCDSLISGFITDNLVKVRNTNIRSSLSDVSKLNIQKKYEIISGSVSSIRLDSIVKTAFHTSRSSIIPYINAGKVLVNGKEIVSNSFPVKEGDIISVRGFGKFKFGGQTGTTKKGKINISILKYI